ncbi:MAG: DNA-3-methyladenine glycosylase I, partial [Pseudomonadota bacterium]
WATILHKRENFRKAFAGFDFYKVARFKESQIKRLLNDAGIVRHRKKIESTINNAKCAQAVIHEFGSLSAYLWSFEPDPQDRPAKFDRQTLLSITQSPQSVALSKDLKARGWSFVGPTTMYALMQSMGLVNDHLEGCFARAEIEAMAGK